MQRTAMLPSASPEQASSIRQEAGGRVAKIDASGPKGSEAGKKGEEG
jgi:hypothetical protein